MKRPLALVALLVLGVVSARAETAGELARRVEDAAPDGPFVAEMTLTTTGDLVRTFTMSAKPLPDGDEARYLEVEAPFNVKDTRYLFFERPKGRSEQFFYLPTMKRVIRLSEKSRREPFLGSTFYIVDLVRPVLDDFTYAFVGEETVAGRACRLVESRPKDPERELYGRSVFAVDPQDLVVVRAELFDHDGKPFKVLHVERLEKIDGNWTPRRQRMDDVRDDATSTLETVSIDYAAEPDDAIFTVGHLGR